MKNRPHFYRFLLRVVFVLINTSLLATGVTRGPGAQGPSLVKMRFAFEATTLSALVYLDQKVAAAVVVSLRIEVFRSEGVLTGVKQLRVVEKSLSRGTTVEQAT